MKLCPFLGPTSRGIVPLDLKCNFKARGKIEDTHTKLENDFPLPLKCNFKGRGKIEDTLPKMAVPPASKMGRLVVHTYILYL